MAETGQRCDQPAAARLGQQAALVIGPTKVVRLPPILVVSADGVVAVENGLVRAALVEGQPRAPRHRLTDRKSPPGTTYEIPYHSTEAGNIR